MRKRQQHRTVDDALQEDLLLPVGRSQVDEPASQNHSRQIRFQHQVSAHRLHHQHGLDTTAAKATVLIGEWNAEQSQRCKPLPHFLGHCLPVGNHVAAKLMRIILLEETLDRIGEHLLFFSQ